MNEELRKQLKDAMRARLKAKMEAQMSYNLWSEVFKTCGIWQNTMNGGYTQTGTPPRRVKHVKCTCRTVKKETK